MPSTKRLRFGTFDFDPETRELRREGTPVKLAAQPAQVLATLLAHPGEIVSREALREAVWGSQTHGDFESGLNFCITQLRSALRDSAESPIFIKTVPKRGYQFIATVTENGEQKAVSHKRPVWILVALAICMAIGVGLYAWSKTSTTRIAIGRFENQTGDPTLNRFTDQLTDAMVGELARTAPDSLRVIGNAPILRAARDRQDINRIATELKANYVILGQVQGSAANGRVLIHLIRLPEQTHLWVTRADDVNFSGGLNIQREITQRAAREVLAKLTK